MGQNARLGMCLAGQEQRRHDPGQARLDRTQALCDMGHLCGRLLPAAHCRRGPQQSSSSRCRSQSAAIMQAAHRLAAVYLLARKDSNISLHVSLRCMDQAGQPHQQAVKAAHQQVMASRRWPAAATLISLRVACLRAALPATKHHLPNMHGLPS